MKPIPTSFEEFEKIINSLSTVEFQSGNTFFAATPQKEQIENITISKIIDTFFPLMAYLIFYEDTLLQLQKEKDKLLAELKETNNQLEHDQEKKQFFSYYSSCFSSLFLMVPEEKNNLNKQKENLEKRITILEKKIIELNKKTNSQKKLTSYWEKIIFSSLFYFSILCSPTFYSNNNSENSIFYGISETSYLDFLNGMDSIISCLGIKNHSAIFKDIMLAQIQCLNKNNGFPSFEAKQRTIAAFIFSLKFNQDWLKNSELSALLGLWLKNINNLEATFLKQLDLYQIGNEFFSNNEYRIENTCPSNTGFTSKDDDTFLVLIPTLPVLIPSKDETLFELNNGHADDYPLPSSFMGHYAFFNNYYKEQTKNLLKEENNISTKKEIHFKN